MTKFIKRILIGVWATVFTLIGAGFVHAVNPGVPVTVPSAGSNNPGALLISNSAGGYTASTSPYFNVILLQGTAASLQNVVASSSQIVYETDTGKFKGGDGVTTIGLLSPLNEFTFNYSTGRAYFSSTTAKVSFGTTTGLAMLTVQGTSSVQDAFDVWDKSGVYNVFNINKNGVITITTNDGSAQTQLSNGFTSLLGNIYLNPSGNSVIIGDPTGNDPGLNWLEVNTTTGLSTFRGEGTDGVSIFAVDAGNRAGYFGDETHNVEVGIGTTTPTAKLAISYNVTDTKTPFIISQNFGTYSTFFVVTDLGNVGIGTSSPYAKLSVVGQVVAPYYTATSTIATSTFFGNIGSYKRMFLDSTNKSWVGMSFGNAVFNSDQNIVINSTNSNGIDIAATTGSINISPGAGFGVTFGNCCTESIVPQGFSFLTSLGIGTTTQYGTSVLSVGGKVTASNYVGTSTTATSTIAGPVDVNGLNLTGNYVYTDSSSVSSPLVIRKDINWFDDSSITLFTAGKGNGADSNGPLQFKWSGCLNDSCEYELLLDGTTYAQLHIGNLIAAGISATSIDSSSILSMSNAGKNMVLTTNPSGYIVASSTPTVAAIIATSTTAFSTFAGKVGIGTTSPWRTISVTGTAAISGLSAFAVGDSAVCQRAGGEITVDSGVSSCIVSTKSAKHDIQKEDSAKALARVLKLQPVIFEYNGSNKPDIGLIAEDVAAIDPRYAQYDPKTLKPKAINWAAITTDMLTVMQADKGIFNTATSTSRSGGAFPVEYLGLVGLLGGIPLIPKKKKQQ